MNSILYRYPNLVQRNELHFYRNSSREPRRLETAPRRLVRKIFSVNLIEFVEVAKISEEYLPIVSQYFSALKVRL